MKLARTQAQSPLRRIVLKQSLRNIIPGKGPSFVLHRNARRHSIDWSTQPLAQRRSTIVRLLDQIEDERGPVMADNRCLAGSLVGMRPAVMNSARQLCVACPQRPKGTRTHPDRRRIADGLGERTEVNGIFGAFAPLYPFFPRKTF